MNIAFPAILFLILTLPGIIFRYTYRKGLWSSPFSMGTLSEEVAYGLSIALILHLAWISFAQLFFPYEPALEALLTMIIGEYSNVHVYDRIVASITSHPVLLSSYFLSLYLFSALFGLGIHYLVRSDGLALDRRTRMFRFDNEWYYLLKGDIDRFGTQYRQRPPDGVMVRTEIFLGNCVLCYRGLVHSFYFNKQGELDRILLTMAHREFYWLTNDLQRTDVAPTEEGLQKRQLDPLENLQGDFVVIKYSQLKSLDVEYLYLDEQYSLDDA